MIRHTIIFCFILIANYGCGTLSEEVEVGVKSTHETQSNSLDSELQVVAVENNTETANIMPIQQSPKLEEYCDKIDTKFKEFSWGKSNCKNIPWFHVRNSHLGKPLIWTVFGNEDEHKIKHKDMTLVLCGVHGDEITPIKFCFDIIQYIQENKQLYSDKLIAVAPIVCPDSFFMDRPTRTNANNVDINRNFPTEDWNKDALRIWKNVYSKDKRRYPGPSAMTEQEVVFQINLIKRYKPNKIISVHAPLTLLDLDGPDDEASNSKKSPRTILANQLLIQMATQAKKYKIKNYPYFPGSLGNYAGNERNIPTYTLELPTSDNRKSKEYWLQFKDAIHSAFTTDLRVHHVVDDGQNQNGNSETIIDPEAVAH